MQEDCITVLAGDGWAHSLAVWKLVLGFRRVIQHCKPLYGESHGWHRSADEQIKQNKQFLDCIQVQTKKENLQHVSDQIQLSAATSYGCYGCFEDVRRRSCFESGMGYDRRLECQGVLTMSTSVLVNVCTCIRVYLCTCVLALALEHEHEH